MIVGDMMDIDIKIRDIGNWSFTGDHAIEDLQSLGKELKKKLIGGKE
jgi:hypothetical protein